MMARDFGCLNYAKNRIMKRIFSVAARRVPRESARKFSRRVGALKMDWTEAAAEEFLYGY